MIPTNYRGYMALATALLAFCGTGRAADWPQWLGPDRNGISQETGLLKDWPATGPAVLWEAPLGDGFSCVAVAQGRVYTQDQRDDKQYLVALDEATGRELWRTATGQGCKDKYGNGPRATPTVVGNRVYALDGAANLVCVNASDGRILWSHDLPAENKLRRNQYGWANSPLVDGGLVVVNAGESAGSSILAFHADTGKLAWHSLDDLAGYASGKVRRVGEKREFVFYTANGLVGLDPADGHLLYRYPWQNQWNNSGITVPLHDDTVLLSTFGIGGCLVRVTPTSQPQVEVVWKNKDYQTEFCTPLLLDGYFYGLSKNAFVCLDYATGKMMWQTKGFSRSTCLYADGHLYILDEQGRLVFARATPEKFEVVSEVKGLLHRQDRNWVMPVVANGRLYLRDADRLLCLEVRAK